MDKYEYKQKTEQMLELMEDGAFSKAAEIADSIDWKRVRNSRMLTDVSDIYEKNGDYQKSYEVLNIAYHRAEGSRKIIYRLCTLALKTKNVDEAIDYYDDFQQAAPNDPNKYILRYQILRAQRAPLDQQIEALEAYKKGEYIEEWAYELAKLYQEAGLTAKCLEECDDLILWFNEGKYVYQAMELKMKYKPLTPSQQEKYDRRFEGLSNETVEMPNVVEYQEEKEAAAAKDSTETLQEEPEGSAEAEPERIIPESRMIDAKGRKIGNTMKLDEALKSLLHLGMEEEDKVQDSSSEPVSTDVTFDEDKLKDAIEEIEAVVDLNLVDELSHQKGLRELKVDPDLEELIPGPEEEEEHKSTLDAATTIMEPIRLELQEETKIAQKPGEEVLKSEKTLEELYAEAGEAIGGTYGDAGEPIDEQYAAAQQLMRELDAEAREAIAELDAEEESIEELEEDTEDVITESYEEAEEDVIEEPYEEAEYAEDATEEPYEEVEEYVEDVTEEPYEEAEEYAEDVTEGPYEEVEEYVEDIIEESYEEVEEDSGDVISEMYEEAEELSAESYEEPDGDIIEELYGEDEEVPAESSEEAEDTPAGSYEEEGEVGDVIAEPYEDGTADAGNAAAEPDKETGKSPTEPDETGRGGQGRNAKPSKSFAEEHKDQIEGQMSLLDIMAGMDTLMEEPPEISESETTHDDMTDSLELEAAKAVESQVRRTERGRTGSAGKTRGTKPILSPDIQKLIDEIEGVSSEEEPGKTKQAQRKAEEQVPEERPENMGEIADQLRVDESSEWFEDYDDVLDDAEYEDELPIQIEETISEEYDENMEISFGGEYEVEATEEYEDITENGDIRENAGKRTGFEIEYQEEEEASGYGIEFDGTENSFAEEESEYAGEYEEAESNPEDYIEEDSGYAEEYAGEDSDYAEEYAGEDPGYAEEYVGEDSGYAEEYTGEYEEESGYPEEYEDTGSEYADGYEDEEYEPGYEEEYSGDYGDEEAYSGDYGDEEEYSGEYGDEEAYSDDYGDEEGEYYEDAYGYADGDEYEYDAASVEANLEDEFSPNDDYRDGYDEREMPEEEEEIDILSKTTPLSRKETAKLIATGKTAPLPMDEISDALSLSDTGFVVHGRYDLRTQSGIGTRAGLTEEQKKLFSYFVPVRGMSEQLVDVLEQDKNCTNRQGTSGTGNLLIIGNKGNGKTVLAVDVVKAIQKQRNIRQGKVAIVTGDSLNKKKVSDIFSKLYGGALIIEKAGKMNEKTVARVNKAMERDTGELLIVLEDQRKPLDRLLTSNREFRRKFTSRLEVPILINDELVTFGQAYAQENGYQIDEMGILALYSRIDMLQREDHAVTIAEVKEVMDEAMEHSQKASAKKLVKRVLGKNRDGSDRIILTEKDFN